MTKWQDRLARLALVIAEAVISPSENTYVNAHAKLRQSPKNAVARFYGSFFNTRGLRGLAGDRRIPIPMLLQRARAPGSHGADRGGVCFAS